MRTVGLLAALAGVTASAFAWGWYSDRVLERERQAAVAPLSVNNMATSATPQRPRVFSAKQPLLTTPHLDDLELVEVATPVPATRRWATVTAAPKEESAPPLALAVSPRRRLSSLEPGDADARAQLVRDIQYELRRVGCYGGEVHGSWSSSTKHAMKLFTERVNATLPLEQPDYVLLTLVQNEKPGTCASGCPDGQLASENGRCLPRAIVAQQRGGRKGLVTAVPPAQDNATESPAAAPLPGRMAVGAPADESSVVPRTLVAPGIAMNDAQAANGIPAPPPADVKQQVARRNAAKRARPHIKRGSTRQVFSNLMRFAP